MSGVSMYSRIVQVQEHHREVLLSGEFFLIVYGAVHVCGLLIGTERDPIISLFMLNYFGSDMNYIL